MAGGEALGVARLVAGRVRPLVGRDLGLGGGVVDGRWRRRGPPLIEGVLARRVGRRVRLEVRVFREEQSAAEGRGRRRRLAGFAGHGRVDGVGDPKAECALSWVFVSCVPFRALSPRERQRSVGGDV